MDIDKRLKRMLAVTLAAACLAVPAGMAVPAGVAKAEATTLRETGYTSGANAGNFGVNDPIDREQMAAMLYRYAVKKGFIRDK